MLLFVFVLQPVLPVLVKMVVIVYREMPWKYFVNVGTDSLVNFVKKVREKYRYQFCKG